MKVLCHSAGHQVSPSQAASFPHSLPEAGSWATQSTTLGVSHFSEKKPHVLEPELMPQGLGLSFLPLTGARLTMVCLNPSSGKSHPEIQPARHLMPERLPLPS